MNYIWQHELESVSNQASIELQQYYKQLQTEACRLLSAVNGTTFRTILPQLNGIGEKCSLLFLFLSYPDIDIFETDNDMIAYIESEYGRSYQERLEQNGLYDDHSLLYVVTYKKVNQLTHYLWEEDLCLLLSQYAQMSPQQVSIVYRQLLAYYNQLAKAANDCLQQITGEAFHQVYPQLLAVDAKCRLLLEGYPLFLTQESTQQQFIELIEQDYRLTHRELFKESFEWYEQDNVMSELTTVSAM